MLFCGVIVHGVLFHGGFSQVAEGAKWRLHYGEHFGGSSSLSPIDDQPGLPADAERRVDYGYLKTIEGVFWGYVGVGFTEHKFATRILPAAEAETETDSSGVAEGDPAPLFREEWRNYSIDFTLYFRRVEGGKINIFLGGGTGGVDRYVAFAGGTRLLEMPQAGKSSLQRQFAGLQYGWRRLGLRLEHEEVQLYTSGEQGAEPWLRYQATYLRFYIPLN